VALRVHVAAAALVLGVRHHADRARGWVGNCGCSCCAERIS